MVEREENQAAESPEEVTVEDPEKAQADESSDAAEPDQPSEEAAPPAEAPENVELAEAGGEAAEEAESAETPDQTDSAADSAETTVESAAEATTEAPAEPSPSSEEDAGEVAGESPDQEAAEVAEDAEVAAETGGDAADADTPAPAAAASEGSTTTKRASKKRWYVIHTYSGHENKVKANLERAIQYAKAQDKFGEIVVATEDYAVMKGGKKHITKRKTFPSYVLIEMEMSDDIRALVQSIPGVTHFVGDKKPAPLSESEVRRIRGEEVRETGKVTTDVPFKVGETVKVTEGPFADFVGSVDEINLERGKLRVMVSIFGRPTAVELDIMHVTSI